VIYSQLVVAVSSWQVQLAVAGAVGSEQLAGAVSSSRCSWQN
tara:strand:- start:261 stop:386 length:126 start_codon:yes stop_codon:yes gene_type:complete